MHAYEIAHLKPVFEDDRGISIHQARGKNRDYSRVRIGKRLASAIDIEIAQRNYWNAIGAPEEQHHFFLGTGFEKL